MYLLEQYIDCVLSFNLSLSLLNSQLRLLLGGEKQMFQLQPAVAFTKIAENLQNLREILNFEPKSFLERSH